jgi:hypothetical protein
LSRGFLALLPVSVVAFALVAAGCGGGSDEATLTKIEFLKKGNAICSAGGQEIKEGFAEFEKEEGPRENTPPTEAQSKKASETILIPAVNRQIEGLRSLGTPEGDEGEVDEILTNAEEALETAEEDPVALIEEEGESPFAKVNREAREYGLTVCGEEGEG